MISYPVLQNQESHLGTPNDLGSQDPLVPDDNKYVISINNTMK